MRVAMGQINPLIGDFRGNIEKMSRMVDLAKTKGCDLIIFPELSFIGYPPLDLLDRPAFVEESIRWWDALERMSEGIGLIAGAVSKNEAKEGKCYHNSLLFFQNGRLIALVNKRLLPFYDVFDEERYFEPGKEPGYAEWRGVRLGLTICEDIWNRDGILPRRYYPCDPVVDLKTIGVDVLINIAASPYYHGKMKNVMIPLLKSVAREVNAPVVFVNQVGGNDELIFQGRSMVCLPYGDIVVQARSFEEDLVVFNTANLMGDFRDAHDDDVDEVIDALCLGLRDYMRKCGFDRAVIGMSGGVDSAVTACIAAMSIGREKVMGVGLPGPYSSKESLEDAYEVARRLGIDWAVIPITGLYEAVVSSMAEVFSGLSPDVTEENVQARLRGLVLMAISNKLGRLLLSTGNKSELAVGYCTLYGDMNGGLAVLGDVPKTFVYAIARRLKEKFGWIPERVITKPPSAELRPNQRDQDTLPPYELLDAVLELYLEENKSLREIVSLGYDEATVHEIIRMVERNEYKRRQAPPVLKVTTKAFGIGRRIPIAHGYKPGHSGGHSS
ncbi:NAD+ synthase [Thermodesulforhabdus norvegica]|uniref:Glutamine-dependent NAD(+) synthetase n=1 Tax=Thermodesulforhabdus norvegica TaxID=39841 RepID=A0A1I4V896_9BACT|nr:NAD+ synthase [Thermodesulforhabdus norvegica]SFM97230.1 NAD+ synthase (glutamine-hydrolysing) [Thermodesulforhabdus norvegica]